MKISIGIEGTFAPHCGKDTLAITRHYEKAQWVQDLSIVQGLGIEQFRYPIAWHRTERSPGNYDWSHLDRFIPCAIREFGLSIIADPLHHTSYPRWLENGFANPEFPRRYEKFVL